jgi:60 kDa SS-A/Ro ribonucleoprotein
MSSLNFRVRNAELTVRNAAGTPVRSISDEMRLTRLTLAHMLWENQFYVDGQESAKAVKDLAARVQPNFVRALAETARLKFKLRHIPLLLLRELARKGQLRAHDLEAVIQRPDEMGEFMSMYWDAGKSPLSNQVKLGLAASFKKFNEYQLAKWDKNSAKVSMRDIMFLSHPKPDSDAQAELFKRVANKELVTPDTWETQLSAGADKKETFTRLMKENKLGALAFLRNLRNMVESGVSELDIRVYGASLNVDKVLPFRFIAAARIMPQFEDLLENMMFRATANQAKLLGKSVLLIDVSGSMFGAKVSAKSDLDRFDAAAALAVLCREICEDVEIYTFSDHGAVRVPPRRGFALIEALDKSQPHMGTLLGMALKGLPNEYDRCIVFTDEATYDRVPAPAKGAKGYVINVGNYEHGVNHGDWTAITGFSEAVLDYIQACESE